MIRSPHRERSRRSSDDSRHPHSALANSRRVGAHARHSGDRRPGLTDCPIYDRGCMGRQQSLASARAPAARTSSIQSGNSKLARTRRCATQGKATRQPDDGCECDCASVHVHTAVASIQYAARDACSWRVAVDEAKRLISVWPASGDSSCRRCLSRIEARFRLKTD